MPDVAILQLEEQHLVRSALAQLDERCRQLLTLLFYRPEPATYDEITATVGMPAGCSQTVAFDIFVDVFCRADGALFQQAGRLSTAIIFRAGE